MFLDRVVAHAHGIPFSLPSIGHNPFNSMSSWRSPYAFRLFEESSIQGTQACFKAVLLNQVYFKSIRFIAAESGRHYSH
jgi:hypothetical protein